MCGRYSLFFDDEYDYDIAKMMDILKQKYLFNLPEHRTLYMAGFYSFFYLFQFPPLRKDKVCRADSLTTYSYQRTFQSNLQLFEYYTFLFADTAFNPAVLRAIKRIIECGKKEGIMVGMCGEAAADPKLIPLLLAFGLDEFSVSATSVLKTRKTIADSSIADCKALADKVMACATEADVQAVLAQQ